MRHVLELVCALIAIACPAPSTPPVAQASPLHPAPFGPSRPSDYHRRSPSKAMLVIHGGGWSDVGAAYVRGIAPVERRWRRRGWTTLSVSYRPGATSITDVVAWYDALRARMPNARICATGESAGGHLALLLATRRPLACVVSLAGVTDLVGLARQAGSGDALGYRYVSGLSMRAFGVRSLPRYSPRARLSSVHRRTRMMLVAAVTDPLVPVEQVAPFARAARAKGLHVTTRVLGAGPVTFVHTTVDRAQLAGSIAAERRFADAAVRR